MYQVRISSIYWATLSDSQLSTVNSGLWTLDSGLSGLRTLWTLDSLDSLHSLDSLDSRLSTLDSRLSHLTSRLSTLDSRLSTLDSRLSRLSHLGVRLLFISLFLSFGIMLTFQLWKTASDSHFTLGGTQTFPVWASGLFPPSHLPIFPSWAVAPSFLSFTRRATCDVRRATCSPRLHSCFTVLMHLPRFPRTPYRYPSPLSSSSPSSDGRTWRDFPPQRHV